MGGAGSINEKGHQFMANMPTEEVFTVPFKTGVNGTVTSTKPSELWRKYYRQLLYYL